ncbi:MAG: YbaK/EbsC family protein [Anaerotignum sp.]|jgi:prolyl-tRNA editing enzyme YbaK/EbsC (Cys-tRNA(Pro) deacylase)|nr:YbaK/EbsC family protein [Anaerotignum sp.]MBR5793441.1 YbaK/EbsC family protein [Anaerotignum sp.]
MSIENVRAYLKDMNCPKEPIEFSQSSATVELAAEAAGVIPARITKTLCLMSKEGPMVICVAGDTKIDNRKFKDKFGLKAKMLTAEETLEATGHAVGGVCPFDLPEGTKAYADISMQRFDTVFPAAGSSNSAVELTCEELFHYGKCIEWVDICKGWQEDEA